MLYYWLSFCDADLPKGKQFQGVAIVEANDVEEAISKAWQYGCNPGGAVLSCELDITNQTAIDMLQPYLYKLLDKDEIDKLGKLVRSHPILNQ